MNVSFFFQINTEINLIRLIFFSIWKFLDSFVPFVLDYYT